MTEMLDSRLPTKCILKLNSIILVQRTGLYPNKLNFGGGGVEKVYFYDNF